MSYTKDEMMVLYQINANIFNLQEIADILPDVNLEEVKAAMHGLRENGLIRKERKKMHLTQKGEEALKTHRKTALGL
ncbi:MAG: hypothetical protein V3V26_00145 [Candidatus Aenigmarchaeota archaeon]